jgi:transcriptional regulator with XRE-family HTH domain
VEVVESENPIGSFLRARRERVRPEEVGLIDDGPRRVPGLRREEIAALAGVSADYYVRLEQGRERHPSGLVLDALARALMLDEHSTAHLHELARAVPSFGPRLTARALDARPGLVRLLDAWPQTPAFITNHRSDVLAANALAGALNPACVVGGNLLRAFFLDEDEQRALFPEYEAVAEDGVAALRAGAAAALDDRRMIELVGELSMRSELFRRLWARHDVLVKSDGDKRIEHPIVGRLELRYETLSVDGAGGQHLTIYHAEPASPSARGLALLASLHAEHHDRA